MASIRTQNLVPSDHGGGLYKSGSASIVTNEYAAKRSEKGHTVHKVVESLGKVIWLSEDKHSGIFLSDTRGLVEYNLDTDRFDEVLRDDPRLNGTPYAPMLVTHTDFGDILGAMTLINKTGIPEVMRTVFTEAKDYERVLCHALHAVLKNCARISCSDFVAHSALSYVIEEINIGTLDHDSTFFDMMGKPESKLAFFKAYLSYMRKDNPDFGCACYVDSTPLPNDVHNNPFNAFSSHGTSGEANQTRLVLILDSATGRPVWFEFIHGNKLDHTTIDMVRNELKVNLDTDIHDLVLDAGYACSELFAQYNADNHQMTDATGSTFTRNMVIRMPEKNGFPHGDMYDQVRSRLYDASYTFVRDEHTYYGERFGPINILGYPEYVYVYLDMQQALALNQKYRSENPEQWEKMSDEEKNWAQFKDGFFELISNREDHPAKLHDMYFGRVAIENLFKTSKEYLALLPLKKWTKERIKGKVLCDIISTIMYLDLRVAAGPAQITIPRLLVSLSSIESTLDRENDMLTITTPNRQIRSLLETLQIPLEGHMKVSDFKRVIKEGHIPTAPSIKARDPMDGRPKGSTKKPSLRVPQSTEQKEAARQAKAAERKAEKDAEKAARNAEKAAEKAVAAADKAAEYAVDGSKTKAHRQAVIAAQEAQKAEEFAIAASVLDTVKKPAQNAAKRAKQAAERAAKCAEKVLPRTPRNNMTANGQK